MGRWILMSDIFQFHANSKSKIYAPRILNYKGNFETCRKCGSVYLKKEIKTVNLEIEGKGKYPDILLCGEWPLLLISDRTLKVWEQNDIGDFNKYSVKLFRGNGEEISDNEVKYHHIVITGQCTLDLDAMGIKIIDQCEACGIVKYNKETWQFGEPIFDQNFANERELFVLEQFKNNPLCSRKNLELIYNNKLTNFLITKCEDMFDYCAEEIDIKKLFTS